MDGNPLRDNEVCLSVTGWEGVGSGCIYLGWEDSGYRFIFHFSDAYALCIDGLVGF